MSKKDPFVIPYCLCGKPNGTKAHISEMTQFRIRGNVVYTNYAGSEISTPFNVKHNGEVFAVGSGSSKQRFYFKNWNK